MSEHADNWPRRATKLAKTLRHAARKFAHFSRTYEAERNKNTSLSNSVKARVDEAYSRLYDARQSLCSIQAGGGRRRTRKQRKTHRRRNQH